MHVSSPSDLFEDSVGERLLHAKEKEAKKRLEKVYQLLNHESFVKGGKITNQKSENSLHEQLGTIFEELIFCQ